MRAATSEAAVAAYFNESVLTGTGWTLLSVRQRANLLVELPGGSAADAAARGQRPDPSPRTPQRARTAAVGAGASGRGGRRTGALHPRGQRNHPLPDPQLRRWRGAADGQGA